MYQTPMKLYPTGMEIKTHTLQLQINAADFDKSFVEIKPTDLEMREGMGLISAAWYKAEITLPETIGKLAVSLPHARLLPSSSYKARIYRGA